MGSETALTRLGDLFCGKTICFVVVQGADEEYGGEEDELRITDTNIELAFTDGTRVRISSGNCDDAGAGVPPLYVRRVAPTQ